MKDYIYYTPKDLALKLMDLIEDKPYKNVIDICCGSWNLLYAAKEKLNCQFITGVDVDKNVKRYKAPKDKVFLEDGREYALRCYEKKRYDLVLSNPPFGLLADDNRVMKTKLKDHKYTPILTKRFESEMLVANMLLLKREGVLVTILPQTFIFGISNINVRKKIARDFQIDTIVKLPEGTFKKNDIRACVVIMRKTKKRKPTLYYIASYSNEWYLNYAGIIDNKRMILGHWELERNYFSKDTDLMIFRGSICSSKFQKNGQNKIFHCSSMIENDIWQPLVKETNERCNGRVTKIGDILVNRIGKKAGYWCVCNKQGYYVSDCIIVIRNLSSKGIEQLENNSVGRRLNIPLRGVSTQYVTENDIRFLLGKELEDTRD